MEARLVDDLPEGPGLAVRTQMGRVPMPGVPGWGRGGARSVPGYGIATGGSGRGRRFSPIAT